MPRPVFEVADVITKYGDAFLTSTGRGVTVRHRRILRALAACRTAALGGHARKCQGCGRIDDISYNSCRDTHCPKCGGSRRARWLQARQRDLLPVPYFHIVFTLPDELAPIALQNKKLVYDLLLKASAQTLVQIAADNRHLGARIGLLAVLHTWGQNLHHHPHVHCVVPGGGLSADGSRWIRSRNNYFLPVAVLRKLFRGKVLHGLEQAYRRDEVELHGRLRNLREPQLWRRHIKPLWKRKWVVYAKPPFGGPELVLKYLARYTHRVAISNHRLLGVDCGRVRFRWRDYRDGQQKVMTLDSEEFLRRFCLHIQPKGLQRIRHYGLLANRTRRHEVARCRQLLRPFAPLATNSEARASANDDTAQQHAIAAPQPCPTCGDIVFIVVELPPWCAYAHQAQLPIKRDTS